MPFSVKVAQISLIIPQNILKNITKCSGFFEQTY